MRKVFLTALLVLACNGRILDFGQGGTGHGPGDGDGPGDGPAGGDLPFDESDLVGCVPETGHDHGAGHVHHGASGLPHGIPDFCANPTNRTLRSGSWSDASIWSAGHVPTAGEVVEVATGTAVDYDAHSDAALSCVAVRGKLKFRPDVSTRLTTGNLMVMSCGYLQVGGKLEPIASAHSAEIVLADRPLDTATDPEQFGTGFFGFGKVRFHGAQKSPTFTRLTAEPLAGDTVLHLSEAPTGWRAGDRLILPDTRQLPFEQQYTPAYVPQRETPTIASISGNAVTLTQPLQFDHRGARNLAGVLELLPHIGNLTRNVVVRSQNTAGTRGHGIFSHRADVDLRYAGFVGLGRTTVQPLDSTTFDASENVTHIGTNQIGRYPIHMHHVMGPRAPTANGYQYVLLGNAVEDATKWGVTVHATHFGMIRENIVYMSGGSAFMTEDGSESRNVFEKNFAVWSWGQGGRQGAGREGGGFWFRGVDNIVRDNVAANILSDGADSAYGYKYFLEYLGNVRIPHFPGADLLNDAEFTVTDAHTMPVRLFENNEVYGATGSGLTYWWIGSWGNEIRAVTGDSIFKNLTAWHLYNKGVFHYPANRVVIDGLKMRSTDQFVTDYNAGGFGIDFGDYFGMGITIRNLDVEGRFFGIAGSPLVDGSTVLIQNSRFANRINIAIQTQWSVSYSGETFTPRRYVIDNVKFDSISDLNIRLEYDENGTKGVTVRDEVVVQNYDQTPGDNFRVFYQQQAPGFITPVSIYNADGTRQRIGAPAAGYTNQQNWDMHQVSVAGAVATCATTRSKIAGAFTCPTP